MERLLGVKLFLRDTRRVTLTAEGARLLPAARRILAQFDELPSIVSPEPTASTRSIFYGVPPWLHPDLRMALTDLEKVHAARYTLRKWPRGSAEIISALQQGDVAFGLARPPFDSAGLVRTVVYEERLGAVLSKERYGTKSSISVSELANLSYVTARRDTDSEYRQQVDSALEAAGVPRRQNVDPGDYVGAADVISIGDGFAIAPLEPNSGGQTYNLAENICVPINDLELTLVTCLVWQANLAERDQEIREVIDTAVTLLRRSAGAQQQPV
ncbi:HTH-type transcriptional regulator YwbI [Mycobacteroides abscessus subsp. abscessus]|nr:HTH-type transcriptional regulator YwbI [Mycobacteroides abscessus subsp. abscessus]SIK81981.1 HTH-type transcriptional regulator YwbI [Mycobacteroides abscessus subsp. abscessus]SKU56083.1 HTH-type transcriptional regulator YwbI [Mycobacteroides abscessus subsp. abscessus]SKY32674.1 HTH-type transcriptional regulator YwbI [Mycobacteroides abscessus subsp. abscessus]SLE26805.1 HTH-type transcriptional regulator YwbI [Mycobacteroides abscessus subsp. abscessus]